MYDTLNFMHNAQDRFGSYKKWYSIHTISGGLYV